MVQAIVYSVDCETYRYRWHFQRKRSLKGGNWSSLGEVCEHAAVPCHSCHFPLPAGLHLVNCCTAIHPPSISTCHLPLRISHLNAFPTQNGNYSAVPRKLFTYHVWALIFTLDKMQRSIQVSNLPQLNRGNWHTN